MSIAKKLDEFLDIYKIANIDLAKNSELSTSYISRLRGGTRTPSINSNTFKKIYNGILEILDEEVIANIDFLKDFPTFKLWLGDDSTRINNDFSTRLNNLMNFFKVQNNVLAKILKVDPSLISRYKTGERKPPWDNQGINELSKFFADKVEKYENIKEINEILDLKITEPFNMELATQSIYEYLVDLGKSVSQINSLFEMTEKYNPAFLDFSQIIHFIDGAQFPTNEVSKRTGIDGLRKQVLNFLTLCAKSNKPLTLKLYSNQSIEWMVEDPEFFNLWKMLMFIILMRGHQIQIVHNLSRSEEELVYAVEGWTPLYLSGYIEGYSNTVPDNDLFSNTIFICSDNFSVTGSTIKGLENDATYTFSSNKNSLKVIEEVFEKILITSDKVMNSVTINTYQDINKLIGNMANLYKDSQIHFFYNKLPVWNLSEELFIKILKANRCESEKSKILIDYLRNLKLAYETVLEEGSICDCFYIPERFSSESCGLDFIDIYGQSTMLCCEEDYKLQLECISDALKKHKNYKVEILNKKFFSNTKFIEIMDKRIITVKSNNPVSVLNFDNSILVEKFKLYRDFLLRNSINSRDNLDHVLSLLEYS
ncbi:MAG: hypothetical protein GXY89_04770 [Tissierellia bacterium]|nr:hypothetical protein [Tissierellia bacterium]